MCGRLTKVIDAFNSRLREGGRSDRGVPQSRALQHQPESKLDLTDLYDSPVAAPTT